MTQTAPEADPTPAVDPATDPVVDPNADPDPSNDPDNDTDPRVQRANRQAAQYRTQLRATETKVGELETKLQETNGVLGKLAAVFGGGDPATPDADPAAQLQQIAGEADNLRTTNQQLTAALLVHELAGDNGGAPNALLDSRRFTDTLAGLDPTADDYREQVATAIKDAVAKNKNLAAGQVPSRGGAPGAGAGPQSPAGAVTQEQFDAMDYPQRTELFRTNPDLYRRLAGTGT